MTDLEKYDLRKKLEEDEMKRPGMVDREIKRTRKEEKVFLEEVNNAMANLGSWLMGA